MSGARMESQSRVQRIKVALLALCRKSMLRATARQMLLQQYLPIAVVERPQPRISAAIGDARPAPPHAIPIGGLAPDPLFPCYRPIRTGVGAAYHDTPAKDQFSHDGCSTRCWAPGE
jgi:hypothetical protein